MKEKLILYKNVYDRKKAVEVSFNDFIYNNLDCISKIDGADPGIYDKIKAEENKQLRNSIKRESLPAASFSQSGIFSIDIDGLQDLPHIKDKIIKSVKNTDPLYYISDGETEVYALQESVSGNLVAYFRYDCAPEDYSSMYFKVYLQMSLIAGITIDYLPDLGRLRYLSNGEVYYFNENAKQCTELHEGDLPVITQKVSPKKSRKLIFKSC